MKAVLIGVYLASPAENMYIRSFTGSFAIADAQRIRKELEKDKRDFREYAIVANKPAWDAWYEQQPHLDEKYLRSLK